MVGIEVRQLPVGQGMESFDVHVLKDLDFVMDVMERY